MSIHSRLSLAALTLSITIAILLCVATPIAICAQAPSAAPASPAIAPPEHPITRGQLATLFTRMKTFEAQKVFLRQVLNTQRKALPAWFPDSVWNEVVHKLDAIDLVDIALPVYQKYVSQGQADDMLLFMEGPTGDEIAQRTTDRALAAVSTGARGSAADDMAMKAGNADGDQALWAKRAKELTPEQRAKILPGVQGLARVWRKIDDEQDVVYNKRENEIFQSILKARQPELQAAQRAASQSAPAHAPAPH